MCLFPSCCYYSDPLHFQALRRLANNLLLWAKKTQQIGKRLCIHDCLNGEACLKDS
jgi:hypothetical protein